jgi:hypothetical protein
VPVQFPNLQAAYDSAWLNAHAVQPARDTAPVVLPAAAIPAPPPPSAYVCNPAHIFVHTKFKAATPVMVFDKFYETNLLGIDYAIDDQGRSYLNIRLEVLNDK